MWFNESHRGEEWGETKDLGFQESPVVRKEKDVRNGQ